MTVILKKKKFTAQHVFNILLLQIAYSLFNNSFHSNTDEMTSNKWMYRQREDEKKHYWILIVLMRTFSIYQGRTLKILDFRRICCPGGASVICHLLSKLILMSNEMKLNFSNNQKKFLELKWRYKLILKLIDVHSILKWIYCFERVIRNYMKLNNL